MLLSSPTSNILRGCRYPSTPRWIGIGARHAIRDAKRIRRRVEGICLLVAGALKGVYELGVRTGARGLSSNGSRFAKHFPRQKQNESTTCHEC